MNVLHLINDLVPCVCAADHVPVRDQPDEAGIPGGERPTTPPHPLPEGPTGEEQHGAMRRLLAGQQLPRLFLPLQHKEMCPCI